MGDVRTTSTKEASDILITHWQNGTTLSELPDQVKPTSIVQGYDIQSHVERLTTSPLWGWKIAATSVHGQHHINVDRPLAGRILSERVTVHDAGPVSLGSNRMRVAELEFAFRVGRDLPPRAPGETWSTDEVMDAVDGCFLGSEIPDSRYADFVAVGAAQLIADNACADLYVIGPEVRDWRDLDLVAHEVRGWIDGTTEVHEGRGGNVLGDPRVAMTWIANELALHGLGLKKGQFVTTGTCIVPVPIKPGDRLVGDYGRMGKFQVDFVA